jgi:transcriptional regulator of aromatic amino acid metabolism
MTLSIGDGADAFGCAQHAPNSVALPTGSSSVIRQVNRLIRQVAAYDSNVLILGESGTGKLAAPGAPVHSHQLRRDSGGAARERAVWPREGRLHRRIVHAQRPL